MDIGKSLGPFDHDAPDGDCPTDGPINENPKSTQPHNLHATHGQQMRLKKRKHISELPFLSDAIENDREIEEEEKLVEAPLADS